MASVFAFISFKRLSSSIFERSLFHEEIVLKEKEFFLRLSTQTSLRSCQGNDRIFFDSRPRLNEDYTKKNVANSSEKKA